MNALTCVSGYWKVNNKHGNKYTTWFRNSLKINCPYVFFGDKETLEMIKPFRDGLPTFYVEYNMHDFVTHKYKNRMRPHPTHSPSVELNLVWNEKIFLIQKAFELNPFHSDFFCWVDAGICIYRNVQPPAIPFPNKDKLSMLPKDKFIYTSSDLYVETNVTTANYYHHISGTTYLLHANIINSFASLYEAYLNTLIDNGNVWTDQVVLTHIYKNNKHLFHKIGHGYGELVHLLI